MSDDTASNPPNARARLEGKTSGASFPPRAADMFDRVNNASAGLARVWDMTNFPKEPDPMVGLRDFTREQQTLMHKVVHTPDPNWETARHTRQQADAMAELLAGIEEQRQVDERKDAERDEREQRALKVAEDSLAEARRSRIITAWSVVIALVSLIVAVITVLVA